MTTEENGWLIEHGLSDVSAPRYWAAGKTDPARPSAWTSNHLQAIRFARRTDAERVTKRIMHGIPVRICEHIWGAADAAAPAVTMRFALQTIHDTFTRDMEQGYRTKDKEFAISMAKLGLAATDAAEPATPGDMAAFGASEHVAYLYPGEDQARERAAFLAGVAFEAETPRAAADAGADAALVRMLRTTLSNEPSDGAMWDRIVDERNRAAAAMERLWRANAYANEVIDQRNSMLSTAEAERDRLREALDRAREVMQRQLDGRTPRPVAHRYRADGKPSKHDRCKHDLAMWEACENCIDEALTAALEIIAITEGVSRTPSSPSATPGSPPDREP